MNENIADFGGDPRRITIFGESSGAENLSLLTYIKEAEPFFSQAIAQSGSAFAHWAINNKAITNTDRMYEELCGSTEKKASSEEKLSFLQGKTREEIDEAHRKLFSPHIIYRAKFPEKTYHGGGHGISGIYLEWAPTIDRDLIPSGGIEEMVKSVVPKPFITGTKSGPTFVPQISVSLSAHLLVRHIGE